MNTDEMKTGRLFWKWMLGMLALVCASVPAQAAIWMETDIGIGAYDYIEKDTTTFVHYGVNWSSWNRSECWVDVNGSGAAYSGSWAHDASPNKHLSTGSLNSGSHGSQWVAGNSIDVYAKIDDNGSDPWNEQASYVDDWMIFDVLLTDVSGIIGPVSKQLVLQFKIDVGSNSGRELTRLWVDNSGGTLTEDGDINEVKLYYENGSSLSFGGNESSVALGAGGSGTDEVWGSDSLNISIPTGSDDLCCYVVIESWRASPTVARTARFQIIADGISMDQFGGTDKKLAKMAATQNSSTLTLRPTDATWDGGGSDNNWLTENNWNNNLYPYAGGSNAILRFDGSTRTSATNNYTAGTIFSQIWFTSTASAFILAGNDFAIKSKIENSDADLQTISNNVTGNTTAFEINPVSGNLTLGGTLNNNGQTVNIYGNNAKTANLNGVVSGSGAIYVKENSIVALTNNNTFSGGLWIEKGTVQLNTHSNSMGSGAVNVGTNATLDLQHGAMELRPVALNLYNGFVNKSLAASESITWPGALTTYNSSTVSVTDSTLYFAGGIAISSGTLNFTNSVEAGMASGGTMTGSGTFEKNGAGVFRLYPGTHSGAINLKQGEIRQYTGTMTASGTLTMEGGTKYSADSSAARTVAKNVVINGNVGLAEHNTGGLTLSGTVGLGGGMRIITNSNAVTISGIISNGGLEKTGAGVMTLSGANTYASGTRISAGVLQVGDNGTAGAITGDITNNAALAYYRTDSHTVSGVLTGTGALTNRAGTLTLTATSTMSGNTVVSGGILVQNGTNVSSAVTVSSGAFLYGTGSNGAVTITGQASAGSATNTVGHLKATALTLPSSGRMAVDITAMTGTAGTHWDLITLGSGGGTYTVNAVDGTDFVIALKGSPSFDQSLSYVLTLVDAGTASGFVANKFTVDTSAFTPSGGFGSSTFTVDATGGDLRLIVTPAAPPTPAGLAATDGSSTANVGLSWTDGARETGYRIWRNTVNTFGTSTNIFTNAANTVTYTDTDVSPGQLYYYWITATNTGGSSAESMSDSGYRKLATVSITGATDGTDTTKVALTWSDVTGETGYGIWRHTANASGSATWLANAAAGATSYDDTTATPGQQYYYWVRATNSTSASQSDFQASGEGGYRKLAQVAGVAATENLSDKITVSWTDGAGETGYAIWRNTSNASNTATYVTTAAANATSYDDTSATAGQDYWYWVRATNSTSTSQSDWSSADYGYRLLTEPSTQASAITFSSVAVTSMTVGWTRGDGNYVLVVAKQGSAPTDPSDSTVYNADAAFGSGDQTAAGSYVVYKGTGTSVPVTGLSAATEYYFAVYEFNGATTPNYRTSDEPVSNKTTLATEPTTQATSLTVTGTNEVSLTGINWTDGNGSSRLVVVKAGSAVDSFPVDATAYTANAAFGSGTQIGTGNYVVHAGSGPLATLSSLSRDVTYHIRVFEFNGSGATANYNTNSSTGNPISLKTMAVTPGGNPTDLTVSAIGSNAFTVTWTKGTTGTNTLIVIRAGANPVDPSDLNSYTANATFGSGTDLGSSSFVVFNDTGSSVTVTNLVPGTSYTIEASSFNGSSGSENYRATPTSTSASTLMPEPTQATSISFSTLGSTSYAVSFTAGNGVSRLVVAKSGSAVTFLPVDGTAYAGENNNFGSGTDLGSGNILVHRGTSPFTLSGLSAQTEYHVRIFEYQGTNATLNYNTNTASGNPANRFTLSTEPSAHAATFTATALSDTQIKLDWGAATGESGFILLRRSGAAPTGTPSDGTAYSQGSTIGDGTVVYVTTAAGAASVTDSYSTAENTAYHYLIFPYSYNGTPANATYNYRTAASVPYATATTAKAEPATSSTLVSFVPASSGSATITWTNTGSADGTIILVKSNSAVSSNPSDWTNYAASTTFASGAQIGTGNYVVFTNAVKFGSVEVTNFVAGSTYHVAVYPYNGSGTLLNYRTTSPATGSLTMLPAPTAQSATADGKTMVRLAWTKNASYDVMIVYRAGSASTDPTQGTAYSVGSSCGGGTVIYKGSAAALEHVVASGTTHYYAFYSYNGNYYSAGATASAATTSFAANEIVETFSYTNNTSLSGLSGSNLWSGAWSVGAGTFTVETNYGSSSVPIFQNMPNYPTNAGNRVKVSDPGNGNSARAERSFTAITSGKIYAAAIMSYQWKGANKWSGISLMSNTTEKVFAGKVSDGTYQYALGLSGVGGTVISSPEYQLKPYGESPGNTGEVYLVVIRYDFSTRELATKGYYRTDTVPTSEPGTWDATDTLSVGDLNSVSGVRISGGSSDGGNTLGIQYFDEVRVATSWGDLIGVAPTKPADPTNQTATADGNEMVRLGWTTNAAGNSVMILHKTTAIATDPTDGTGYSVGNTIGGATVIYKGATNKLEHVVSPGTTNFYKIYAYNGSDYYSTGVVASATNNAYADYERVNPFSYTNGTALGPTTAGGQGFGANSWTVDSGTWTAQTNYSTAVADSVPKFFNMSNYPSMQGNLVYAANPGNGGVARAQRSLSSAINTGTVYIAFMMSYQYRGANKWAGVSFFNGSTEKAFFGKGAGGNWNTLGLGDGTTTYWSATDLQEFYSGAGNTGNVYLVVGKYDFTSKQLAAKAYKILAGGTFPETEPTWDVTQTLGTGIDSIDRIKLNVGSTDGGATIGKVFFDEIRYATNWTGLIAVSCPTWAGSNLLNNVAWGAASNVWLGDTENFQFQSYPTGLGQSGAIEMDWARNGSFGTSYPMTWWKNANNNSYWTNQVQLTTAGSVTSRYVATGGGCTPVRTNNFALTVQNLNPPTGVTAARDGVNTNSQINLAWTRGVSGVAKDVVIVRQTADSGWTAPANGTTYNASDPLGSGTVVYRGSGTSFNDTGLAPSTTYYYRFYSENWSYYSTNVVATNAATSAGSQVFVVDGNPADWSGAASAILNNSASSVQQFIWTDKKGEVRRENGDHANGDIAEFRVAADTDWVYFLVKMTNITDATKPYVAIGVDTRTNASSAEQNWLGDNSGLLVGGGYFGSANARYHQHQINVHHVAATNVPIIEINEVDVDGWHKPPTASHTNVVISTTYETIELKVPRADLNLTGTKTARFTVAAFLNTGSWNNDGDGTVQIANNTPDAVDAVSIPAWSVEDNAANLSAWAEDLGDGDLDFWFDVKFGAASLVDNSRPSTPVLVTPTNNALSLANPTLSWQVSSDSDGQITGYLLEVSTNDQFNGVSGAENGAVDLRVNLSATTTNYTFSTATNQYYWRVRARDTAGELSLATTRVFQITGKLDAEGPQPTLVYVGTNVAGFLAGDAEITNRIARYGYITNVLDSEIQNSNNVFGFVLRWDDASGVYATNKAHANSGGGPGAGQFAFNIVSGDGRVSPNWDVYEINTTNAGLNREWGIDKPFYATNTQATGNADVTMTNYIVAAFQVSNYNPNVQYNLMVSAEDSYQIGGSWWTFGSWYSYGTTSSPVTSGWCEDGPYTVRNVTTNMLIQIGVTDDDNRPPVATTNLGWSNSGTNTSLVISNASARLTYSLGQGQDVLYQATDGGLTNSSLAFSFNVYDAWLKGMAIGTNSTYTAAGRTLTNTHFVVEGWQTNWANFSAARSVTTDTTLASTMLTWYWPALTTNDVTALWGTNDLAAAAGITNYVQLNLFDTDNNREGDQASDLAILGRLRIVDDDPTDPVVTNLTVTGTGLASEYVVTNLVTWEFTGTGDARLPATVVAAGVTSSPISHGPSGALQGTDQVFMNAQFYKPATNRYLTFSITPGTGKTFKADSISFESRVSSANGPDTIELWGTMPGGSETLWATNVIDLFDPDNLNGTNWNSYLVISSGVSVAMASASTGTVTFKLLARVTDTNHLVSEDNANWYVDNLTVSGYVFGEAGGAQVTDRDLARGTAQFNLQAYDVYSGLDATTGAATGRAPRVDFWNVSSNVVPITNAFVTNGLNGGSGALTGATPIAVAGMAPAADKRSIALGSGGGALTYYARATVNDYDLDRAGDALAATAGATNLVYDNDSSRPVRGYLYGGPLGVFVDGNLTKAVSSGNNREYRINDEQLMTAAATSIAVKVNLYDFSGWTVPALSFSNATAGAIATNGWLTALLTDTVDTTNKPDAAMEWRLSKSQADTFFNTYESMTNEFRIVSTWDKDNDRQDASSNNVDNLELADARIGYLTFIDNDVGQANVQSNWSVSRNEWSVPRIFLGLPGDAARSNLYLGGLPSDTNTGTVLSGLTNRVYDSQLAKVSAAAPLSVVLPAYDTGGGGSGRTIKGVQRGTSLTESSSNGGVHTITNTWISIGTATVQNAANYRSDLSSSLALTKIAAQFPTSIWAFTAFSYAELGNWLPGAATASNQVMSAGLYDADDNRPGDQRFRSISLGILQVLDNDTVAPSLPTNVKVNGQALVGALDRNTAAWTNTPDFRVSFKPSADGAKAADDLEATGIGEYRTVNAKADIGPDEGIPLAVPADGALANYGFENGSTNWTLTGASVSSEQAYEGLYSVKMTASTAQQTVRLFNTNGYAPRVTVLGAQYRGTGTVDLTVSGLDTNGAPVGGASFNVSIVGTAGVWVAGSSAATTLATTVDRVQVTLTSGANTYWDDIRVKIELLDGGTPVDDVSALFTASAQGLTTNYLYAVDRDNNRASDRKASSAPADAYVPAFGIAYDVTPPTAVTNLDAATDNVDDPTTQFDVQWSIANVGPDDDAHANHPTHNPAHRDIYSPWRSYKIYYGTFDTLHVPGGDPGQGNTNAYIYTNFIRTGAYLAWSNVTSTSTIADPSAAGTNYLALTNLSQASIRLYDLEFDQDYAVVIVGLDKAGNEGPALPGSWATNNTIKFAVTQGVMKARAAVESAFPTNNNLRTGDKGAAALYWIAAGPTNAQGQYTQVNKDYDLIYMDANSFNETSNSTWSLVGTIRTNWFTDAQGQDYGRGMLRFYRASYKDRWRRTNVVSGLPQRPLASEDVYAMHNVILSEGNNYVGLHGQPYTNTFGGVFGTDTNLWPAADSPANGATSIKFYSAGVTALVSSTYFFGNDGEWYRDGNPTPVTTTLQTNGFFEKGFSITLPKPLPTRFVATNVTAVDQNLGSNLAAMVWHPVLKVPTNGPGGGATYSHEIKCGARSSGRTNLVAVQNLVALNLPVSVHPSQMRLLESGFTKGGKEDSDQIYTINTATKTVMSGSTIYCDASSVWRFRQGDAPVPWGYFKPNDVIVIVSRNGGLTNTWTWTYSPTNFYTLPTRWMGQ